MMLQRLKQLNKQQDGFTFIELIIGVAMVGLVSIAAALLMGIMFKVNASSLHRATAIHQVQNAGMWITQDVQSAQTVTIGTGNRILEVLWTDWEGTKYKIDYDYDTVVTGDLVRKYYVIHTNDAGYPAFSINPTATTVIAHYIDHAGTTFVPSGSVYTLTVRAIITGLSANGQPTVETRKYEILPRPGS